MDQRHDHDQAISRRAFLKAAAGSAAAAGIGFELTPGQARAAAYSLPEPDRLFCGVQIASHSALDEGIDYCLDLLGEQAAVNALLFNPVSYYGAMGRPKELQGDHGRPLRDNSRRKLTQIWFTPHEKHYKDTTLRHKPADPSREYAGRELFHELAEPCKKRGMKLYVRWYEPAADFIPVENWKSVLYIDAEGKRGKRPCWNNPDYRAFVAATMQDLFASYPLDGIQYSVERMGPLAEALFDGFTPHCFCAHCQARAKREGIDAERARQGALALGRTMRGIMDGTLKPTDGVMVEIMRQIIRYPELLAWERQWRLAGEEVNQIALKTVKAARPGAAVGLHQDHLQSSWDFIFRATLAWDEVAVGYDWIKPILYHEILGPRIRTRYLDRLKAGLFKELTLEQSLELYYSVFGYDKGAEPKLADLDKGFSPEYVYRESKRYVAGFGHRAKFYAGIGVDIPAGQGWGDMVWQSDPEKLARAVHRSFDAGGQGIVISREYEEMTLPSLKVIGKTIREIAKQ